MDSLAPLSSRSARLDQMFRVVNFVKTFELRTSCMTLSMKETLTTVRGRTGYVSGRGYCGRDTVSVGPGAVR